MVHRLHLLDVRAGGEHLLTAVDHHGPHIVAARGLLGEFLQPVLRGDVQRVHGRAVETQRADAFGDFERDGHREQVNGH